MASTHHLQTASPSTTDFRFSGKSSDWLGLIQKICAQLRHAAWPELLLLLSCQGSSCSLEAGLKAATPRSSWIPFICSQSPLFTVVVFFKASANTEGANTELLLPEKTEA